MRKSKTSFIFSIYVLLIISCAFNVFGAEKKSIDNLLPGGYVKGDVFKSGLGVPVGSILASRGEAVIIHAGGNTGYTAVKGLPLYKGDIVVTKDNGQLQLSLKDESVLTLISNTYLELTESVYDPAHKSRFSFLKMSLGKIRYLVKKFKDMKRSEFEVETTTMVCGVRGSDFVIAIDSTRAEVTTFEDTRLEILSAIAPEAPPTMLGDFQKVTVEEGKLPGVPQDITQEEADALKQEFVLSGVPEAEELSVEERQGTSTGAVSEPGRIGENIEVLVSEKELVNPETAIGPEELGGLARTDVLNEIQRSDEIENIRNDQVQIQEIINQPVQELPGFPVMPE
jgi:hypothetical protein